MIPADTQRNAITQALLANVNPPPQTQMPGPYASINAAQAMPGRQPAGLAAQAAVAPAPTPGAGLAGTQPLTTPLPGQNPLVQQPGQQLMPQGVQPRTY